MRRFRKATLAALTLMLAPQVAAQNTGGVFGPVVNEGHRSFQYRFGYDFDSNRHAQRIHYQQSLDGDRMWRVIGQFSESADSDFDFDFVQGELFWQLSADGERWQQGLRFDLRLRDGDRPTTIGANWMHQFPVGENWTGRAILLTAVDVGSNGRDGIALQTRGQLSRPLSDGREFGLQMFNAYGTTDKFRDFSDQSHQIGPFFSARFGQGWSAMANLLIGATSGTPDTNFGLWVGRSL